MKTYQDLLKEKQELDQQIKIARETELSNAVAQVRSIVSQYGLTSEDVFPTPRAKRATSGQKVEPKYRHPETGATWTGRGKPPLWIAEATDREIFAIKA